MAGFTAVTGAGGGGQFQLITKSGTNQWHGQANIYHRDNSTTANDWFNNLSGIRAPKLVQNQFGGSIGGPIKHDKAYFFFDYTASRIARQTAVLRIVPLPSYHAGNVSYINNNPGCTSTSRQNTTPGCISQLTPAQVKAMDPAGVGNSPAVLICSTVIPRQRCNRRRRCQLRRLPFQRPNANQYRSSYVGRVDYNLTSKIRLGARGRSRD